MKKVLLTLLVGGIASTFVSHDEGAWAVIVAAMAAHHFFAQERQWKNHPGTVLLMAVVIGTAFGLFGHWDLNQMRR